MTTILQAFKDATFRSKSLRVEMTSPLRPARRAKFAQGWLGQPPRYCGTAQVRWTDGSGGKCVQEFRIGVVRSNGEEKVFVDGGHRKIGTDTDLELPWKHVERFRVPIRFAGTLRRRNATLKATLRYLRSWGFHPSRAPSGGYSLSFPRQPSFGPILAVALAKRLGKKLAKEQAHAGGSMLPEDVEVLAGDPKIAAFEEGFKHTYEAHKYERDPRLVEAAREKHGRRCLVCGFDFGEVYGHRGAGFVEVHHTKPIASGPRVTTVNDVVVLCANCHRMLHRGRSVMDWKTLRKKVQSHPEVQARRERRKHELPPIVSKRVRYLSALMWRGA